MGEFSNYPEELEGPPRENAAPSQRAQWVEKAWRYIKDLATAASAATGDITDLETDVATINATLTTLEIDAARAYRGTSDQTGVNPNNSAVLINLNTESYNYGLTTELSTDRYIQVARAGVYQVTGSISLLNTNILAARYQARIYQGTTTFGSASTVLQGNNSVFTVNVGQVINVTGQVLCAANDRFFLGLFGAGNNSVSTLTVSNNESATFMSVSLVREV